MYDNFDTDFNNLVETASRGVAELQALTAAVQALTAKEITIPTPLISGAPVARCAITTADMLDNYQLDAEEAVDWLEKHAQTMSNVMEQAGWEYIASNSPYEDKPKEPLPGPQPGDPEQTPLERLEGAMQWLLDDLFEADEHANQETGVDYDSYVEGRAALTAYRASKPPAVRPDTPEEIEAKVDIRETARNMILDLCGSSLTLTIDDDSSVDLDCDGGAIVTCFLFVPLEDDEEDE